MEIDTIELQVLRKHLSLTFDPDMLLEVHRDWLHGYITLCVRRDLMGIQKEHRWTTPATWWDHLKMHLRSKYDFFRGLRVNYTNHTVVASALFAIPVPVQRQYDVIYTIGDHTCRN